MEKMLASAASAYMPQIGSMAETRKAELMDIKAKIRSDPEQVEAWFDREIEKLAKMDVSEMLGSLR
jgi:hypothetical protein